MPQNIFDDNLFQDQKEVEAQEKRNQRQWKIVVCVLVVVCLIIDGVLGSTAMAHNIFPFLNKDSSALPFLASFIAIPTVFILSNIFIFALGLKLYKYLSQDKKIHVNILSSLESIISCLLFTIALFSFISTTIWAVVFLFGMLVLDKSLAFLFSLSVPLASISYIILAIYIIYRIIHLGIFDRKS